MNIKIMPTEEDEKFVKKFQPVTSKIDESRKITLRQVVGRGVSLKKQGERKHDVITSLKKQGERKHDENTRRKKT